MTSISQLASPSLVLPVPPALGRMPAIDLLRGLIVVLMTIDHTRDFWSATPFRPEDLSQTSVGLFLTRWITHLCAPAFVLLAGMSAYLLGKRLQSPRQLSRFLLTRGIWLMLLDVTLLTLSWQFAYRFVFLQVIWVIGASMILLAGLIWLPRWLIAGFGIILIAGHNLLDGWQPQTAGLWWTLLHKQDIFLISSGWPPVFVAYPLLPWPGVIAVGYWLGGWFEQSAPVRDRWLAGLGGLLLVAFVALRLVNGYGDPNPWQLQPGGAVYSALSFINLTKYPPSLLYLSVTLGLTLLLLSGINRLKGPVREVLLTYGRVPLFFYLLHIPMLHGAAALWTFIRYGRPLNLMFDRPQSWPDTYQPSLVRLYAVCFVTLIIMYAACRWYGNIKRSHANAWLSYL